MSSRSIFAGVRHIVRVVAKTLFISALVVVIFQNVAIAAADDGSVSPSRRRLRPASPSRGCRTRPCIGALRKTICPRTRRIFSSYYWMTSASAFPTPMAVRSTRRTFRASPRKGISYNTFHTTSICSPTRAALLTGRNHQRVGSGTIAERAVDWDGYTGVIPRTRRRSPRCSAIWLQDRRLRQMAQYTGDGNDGDGTFHAMADRRGRRV